MSEHMRISCPVTWRSTIPCSTVLPRRSLACTVRHVRCLCILKEHIPGPEAGLKEWLIRKGGVVSGVDLLTSSSSAAHKRREILATEVLEPGRLLVTVPRTCQLRYDDVDDPAMHELFSKVPRGSSDASEGAWQFKQALALLWHLAKGSSSPLQPYLETLPGISNGVASPRLGMVLMDEAVQELQYTPLIEDVLNQKYWWERFYTDVLQEAGNRDSAGPLPGLCVDKQMFGWAVAVTNSRSFGLRRRGTHVMPGFIDMIDHEPSRCNCEVSSDDYGAVSLYATKCVQPGDAMRLTYGPHDNRNLLISYGFVMLPSNPSDKFEFDFDKNIILELMGQARPGSTTKLAPWQEGVLLNLGLQDPRAPVPPPGLPDSAQEDSAFPQVQLESVVAEKDGVSKAESPAGLALQRRVYFRAPLQAAAPAASTASSSGKPEEPILLLPVDPRLLAAVRVMMLSDPGGTAVGSDVQGLIAGLSLDQLGDWMAPLGRQHELDVLRVLTLLCTALYQSMGTTLQQDRVMQQQLEGALAAGGEQSVGNDAAVGGVGALQATLNPTGAAEARVMAGDVLLAVQYRITVKGTLERALKSVLERCKVLKDPHQA